MNLRIDTSEPPKRPAYLSTLMKAAKDKEKREADVYETFLEEADCAHVALVRCADVGVNTTGSIAGRKRDCNNRSLELIFFFYSKLQGAAAQLGVHAPTMDEIMWSSNTISFYELTLFCRDFNIIPALLSKDEMRFIWRVTSPQWLDTDDLRSLRFCDFSDLLVRMAVVAYNKPIMMQLLQMEHGYMPPACDLVNAFINYLRLGDYAWVKNRIETVGRETVRLMNGRSVGEVDPNAKANLRNEVAAKRLSKFMSGRKHNYGACRGADSKQCRNKLNNEDDDESLFRGQSTDKMPLQMQKVSSALLLKTIGVSSPKTNPGAMGSARLASPIDAAVDDIFRKTVLESEEKASPVSARKKSISHANPVTNHSHALVIMNESVDSSDEEEEDLMLDTTADEKPKGIHVSSKQNSDKRFDNRISNHNKPSKSNAMISVAQENALLNLDPSLTALLAPYTLMKPADAIEAGSRGKAADKMLDGTNENPYFIESGSCFVDLGLVAEGSECVVSMIITNKHRNELLFDVVARGLEGQEPCIRVVATPIAPGMHRTIRLHLKPTIVEPECNHNILGYMDLYFKPKLNNSKKTLDNDMQCLTCPIFYRIPRSTEKYLPSVNHNNTHGTTGTTGKTGRVDRARVLPRLTAKNMIHMLDRARRKKQVEEHKMTRTRIPAYHSSDMNDMKSYYDL